MVLGQEMESYPIIIWDCAHNIYDNKQRRHLIMNVAVDWYTNLHTFNNVGHGSSLKYQHGAFLRIKYMAGLYYVPLPFVRGHNFSIQVSSMWN